MPFDAFSAVDLLDQAVWITSPDGSRVERVSAAYERLSGRAATELRRDPRAWLEAVHRDDRDAVQEAVRDAATRPYSIGYRMSLDGSTRWIRGRGGPLRDESGRVVAVAHTADDTTELEHARFRIARLERETDDFAVAASHDLKEPLRKVRMFGDLLWQEHAARLDDEGRTWLDHMRDGARRMGVLIDDLVALTLPTDAERRWGEVSLDAALRDVLADLRGAIDDAGASIRTEPLPVVTGDAIQLRQLLYNLVSNSLKFRHGDRAPAIFIRACSEGERVTIDLEDNGIGFDEGEAEAIFAPFYRLHTREQVPGAGLGLAIGRRIAERHGGSIRGRRAPEGGSIFSVVLPSCPDAKNG